jgi:hypothetical protein
MIICYSINPLTRFKTNSSIHQLVLSAQCTAAADQHAREHTSRLPVSLMARTENVSSPCRNTSPPHAYVCACDCELLRAAPSPPAVNDDAEDGGLYELPAGGGRNASVLSSVDKAPTNSGLLIAQPCGSARRHYSIGRVRYYI